MDYIPPKRAEKLAWYQNLSANAAPATAAIGAPPGDAVAVAGNADAIIAAMQATNTLEAQLKAARLAEASVIATNLPPIRAKVRNWKTLGLYPASGVEATLKLKGAESDLDPATYKPVIQVSIEAGKIKVDFQKRGVDGIAVYCRLRGTPGWNRIGTDTTPPYFDTNPLANPAVPEVREYKARGMVGDEEIGLDSDIVSLTFGG